ncbi:MAG: hypothetical protein U0457_17685 [Candidatus Sericytochromatia bacterium]
MGDNTISSRVFVPQQQTTNTPQPNLPKLDLSLPTNFNLENMATNSRVGDGFKQQAESTRNYNFNMPDLKFQNPNPREALRDFAVENLGETGSKVAGAAVVGGILASGGKISGSTEILGGTLKATVSTDSIRLGFKKTF